MPPKRKNPVKKDIEPEEESEKEETEHKLKKVKETKKDAKPAKTDEPTTESVGRSTRSKSNPKDEQPKEKDTKSAKAKASPKAKGGKAKKGKEEEEDDDEAMDVEKEEKKETTKAAEKTKASPAKAKASPGKPAAEAKKAKNDKDDKKAKASPKAKKGEAEKKDEDDDDKEEEKDDKKEKTKENKKDKSAANKEGDKEEEEEEEDPKPKGKRGAKKAVTEDTKVVASTSKGTKTLNRNRSANEDVLDNYAGNSRPIPTGDGKLEGSEILITSWNVNGLNALLGKKHLETYMSEKKPDIICLNETKLTDENCEEKGMKWIPAGYTGYFNCCKVKKGYAGTAIVSKVHPISVKFDIGIKKHDTEGRTITAEYENFYLVSCYVPNAGDKLQGLDYRTKEWDADFKNYLDELKKKKHVILCGDLNVAHKDIDIYDPKGKKKNAGFTDQERSSFGALLESGYVDTFRHFYPEEKKYSYFTIKHDMRSTNRGWRLDYFVIDKEGLHGVKDSQIDGNVLGSDHQPIELKLDPQFTQS